MASLSLASDAEVDQFALPLMQYHVLQFDVTMDDLLAVHVPQPGYHL